MVGIIQLKFIPPPPPHTHTHTQDRSAFSSITDLGVRKAVDGWLRSPLPLTHPLS